MEERQLYDIEPAEFYIKEKIVQDNGDYQYILEPVKIIDFCPVCCSLNVIKHGLATRNVRDLSSYGHRVGLTILGHRYRCKECGATQSDTYASIEDDAQVTNRLRDHIQEESLVKPFLNIAEEFGITDTTVRRIFLNYAQKLDNQRTLCAPTVLGIDENHLMNKMRCVLTDVENGRIIEMLPDRKVETIEAFLDTLPYKERVKCITMDMYEHYRRVMHRKLPGVPIVADPFHVIKNLNVALDTIRKRLRADIIEEAKEEYQKLHPGSKRSLPADYQKPNTYKWLLITNIEDINKNVRKRQLLNNFFANYPQFKKPYELKEQFRAIYKCKSQAEAIRAFEQWEQNAAGYPEFKAFAKTVRNWETEIFEHFNYRYSNACTEALNGVINRIGEAGRGYSFDVLRLKVLFGTKASKKARYEFTDYISPKRETGKYAMAICLVDDRPKGKIICGDGVDIQELWQLLQDKEGIFNI